MQVYAPIDNLSHAFHRTFFVFISPEGNRLSEPGAVRALRCQLPRKNPFYGFHPPPLSETNPPPLTEEQLNHVRLQDPWWRKPKQQLEESERPNGVKCPPLFTEHELVVEAEPEEDAADSIIRTTSGQNQFDKSGEADNEGELPGEVLDVLEAATTPAQSQFAEFSARIAREPAQVLRYCFEEGALPLCPGPSPLPDPSSIPLCQLCGAPRRFEFQIMPQLLNHLGIDAEDESGPDFGTIAVYSCPNSCGVQGGGGSSSPSVPESAYIDEWVWVEPPIR